MDSKWKRGGIGDVLDDSFLWTALDKNVVKEAFAGKVQDVLKRLDARFRLTICDEWVRIGPIAAPGEGKEIVAVVEEAVELVSVLSSVAETSEDEPPADSVDTVEELEEAALPAGKMPSDDHQLVHRCTDPLEADFVQGLLKKHGIYSKVIGTRMAALLGAAPFIFRLKILVPTGSADKARKLLAQVFEEGIERKKWIDSVDEVIFQKKRAVAFGISFVFPGGGHFYIMRPLLGLIMGGSIISGVALIMIGNYVLWGMWLILAGVLTDLVGAQISFNSMKQNKLLKAGVQSIVGLLMLAIIFLIAAGGVFLSSGN
jgi:hypothetical protein